MPKYTFMCHSCGTSVQKYVSASKQSIVCKSCGSDVSRQMPNLSGPAEVREVVNPHTNTKWKKDQKEMVEERKEDYYWSVEVPRFVQTYSLETCLEQGWCYIDDEGKVQIHTKPPHKR